MPTATTVTTWDMYDTLMSPEDETVCSPERADYPEAKVDSSRGAERSVSVGSTASTGNTRTLERMLLHSGLYCSFYSIL